MLHFISHLLKALRNPIDAPTPFFVDHERGGPAVEQLEPRILFSAAPIEAPATESSDLVIEAAAPVSETKKVSDAVANGPASLDSSASDSMSNPQVALIEFDVATMPLNQETIEALAAEAKQRWIASEISAEQIAVLDTIQYHIADVGGAHLGVANGFSITIDDDAGGTGTGNWFIDATPDLDEEFGGGVSAASGRFDLLSTLIHEQGHVLGLGDLYADRTDVMDGYLDAGIRRLPSEGQANGAIAGAIVGDNFLTANIVRASTDSSGGQANDHSNTSVISGNGRYVAFESLASDLVAGDSNGQRDIFVKDLATGEVTRASTDSAGAQATGGDSFSASISADGRYVSFHSSATNLVTGDTNNDDDIFVKDLLTGVTTRVSTDATGAQALGGDSRASVISTDGRYVVFTSSATNLVVGDTNTVADIFRKDLQTGEIVRVSVTRDGNEAIGGSAIRSSISGDGRYVTFSSGASNLVAGDTNSEADIFVKDLKTGVLRRVNTNSAGEQSAADLTFDSSISADGRYVAFRSFADDLVADDSNGSFDVFVKDLKTGKTTRVSTDSDGAQGNAGSNSYDASISADGRFVVFNSDSDNLVSGDTNGLTDVFVKDLKSGVITRLSTDSAGGQSSGGASADAAISADGRFVSFTALASNLVAGDTNSRADIFAKAISSINPYTTSVHVDGMGNLIIEDIEGGDSKDNLFIGIKDGRLEVSDRKNSVGSSVFGSELVGTKGRAVSIDLESFTGDIIVRTLGGDDTITIGDLSGLPGGVVVNGGDDHDLIKQAGVVMLTGAGAIDYQAESIRLERKSQLMTETGDIDVRANGLSTSLKKSVGLIARGGAKVSSVDGNIALFGNGGSKGSGNHGIDLRNVEISSTTGDVSLSGGGGPGVSGNRGIYLSKAVITLGGGNLHIQGGGQGTGGGGNVAVTVGKGTMLNVGGTGNVAVSGTSSGMKGGNRGIVIANGVEIRSSAGKITVVGNGGGFSVPSAVLASTSSNTGLQIGKAIIDSTDGGIIELGGVGGGIGSNSMGAILKGTAISTTHNSAGAAVAFGAQGSKVGEGSRNAGLFLSSVDILASGNITVTAVGGAGVNSNYAVRIANSSLVSTAAGVQVKGGIRQSLLQELSTSGNSNYGAYVSNSRIEGFDNASIEGYANFGVSNNYGVRLVNSKLISDAAGQGTVVVAASIEINTGRNNRGLDARGSDFAGKLVYLASEGGGGTNSNDSLILNRSTVSALDGDIQIEAGGELLLAPVVDLNSATTGSNNRGADIRSSVLTATTGLALSATSSGGNSNNVGLQSLNSTFTTGGNLTVTAVGQANMNGSNNRGLYARGGGFSGDVVSITSERGGGLNNNEALHLNGTNVIAMTGVLTIEAGTDNAPVTTGKNNSGAYLKNLDLGAEGGISLTADASGGTRDNVGVKLVRSTLFSGTASILVSGTSLGGLDARGATGVSLDRTELKAKGGVVISGTGGSGDRDNRGVSVVGGMIETAASDIDFTGIANSLTTGTGNIGVFLFNGLTLIPGAGINVDGTGGGGTGFNHGVFMNQNITAPGANISGTATDGVSEDEAGDFFPVM